MKVLIIVPDPTPYGGTSRFLERLLEIHAGQGIDSVLLVPSDRCHDELVSLAARFDAVLVPSPNRVRPDTAPFLTPFFDFFFSWQAVMRHRPDLIVVSTGDPGRATIACYYPVPVLYVLHTMPEHRFRLLPRVYLRTAFLFNNLVMTVSKAAAAEISDAMAVPLGKIEVVHNSCRVPAAADPADSPLILTVGHHVSYKNPEIWLEVACKVLGHLPEATFAWVGDGDLLESTRQKVRQLGLASRLLLPGYAADTRSWYQRAQVYFQPSLRESHGIAVLEAMAHCMPCVVADTGGLPESVLEGETGFVCRPDDVAGFAGRILQLLGDRKLREDLGGAGCTLVERQFSEAAQEREILKLYGTLMSKGGRLVKE